MKHTIEELQALAAEARCNIMRCIGSLGKGHVGGSLSMADLMVALYYEVMNVDPADPQKKGRDRLVISKGHGGPALYAVLAMKGFFPLEQLLTLNKPHTHLPSHCDRLLTPGVDMTTGSLGQGLSAAVGMALADRMDKNDATVYCVIGDGESQEGQIWEAGMFAAQQKVDNLILFLDQNRNQIDGPVAEVNSLIDAAAKWRAFGWHVQEINGHDFMAILSAIDAAKAAKGKPSVIVMDTVKGKGWKRVEGTVKCHSMPVSQDDVAEAIRDFKG